MFESAQALARPQWKEMVRQQQKELRKLSPVADCKPQVQRPELGDHMRVQVLGDIVELEQAQVDHKRVGELGGILGWEQVGTVVCIGALDGTEELVGIGIEEPEQSVGQCCMTRTRVQH